MEGFIGRLGGFFLNWQQNGKSSTISGDWDGEDKRNDVTTPGHCVLCVGQTAHSCFMHSLLPGRSKFAWQLLVRRWTNCLYKALLTHTELLWSLLIYCWSNLGFMLLFRASHNIMYSLSSPSRLIYALLVFSMYCIWLPVDYCDLWTLLRARYFFYMGSDVLIIYVWSDQAKPSTRIIYFVECYVIQQRCLWW